MTISFTKEKIILEFPRNNFPNLSAEVIEKEVEHSLQKLSAIKDYASGKISKRDLIFIVGIEVASDIIQAKTLTENSIKRAIYEYKTSV